MLRTLHTLVGLHDEKPLLADLTTIRELPGCDSIELYKGLDENETFHVLTSTWKSEGTFDAFWAQTLGGDFAEVLRLLGGHAAETDETEFYRCERFALVDGRWTPQDADPSGRAILWPAHGEVRVIIQNAVTPTPAMYDKIRAEIADTRRELGCLAYTWCENVELPGHLLLEEVWADQAIYDQHWVLRQHIADFLGDNLRTPAPPQRGPLAREFYRRQAFEHHYNRWQPVTADGFSHTIVWPAS